MLPHNIASFTVSGNGTIPKLSYTIRHTPFAIHHRRYSAREQSGSWRDALPLPCALQAHFALHEHTTGLASYSRQKHRIAKSAQSIDLMSCSRKKQPRFLRSGQPWENVAAPLRLLRIQHCYYWQMGLAWLCRSHVRSARGLVCRRHVWWPGSWEWQFRW